MQPVVQRSSPTEVALPRLASLAREVHAFLVAAKHRLDEEIRCYPTPIPRCDAQFNFLYAQRTRLQEQINGIADALATGLERKSCMNVLDDFVRAPPLTDLVSEQALRSTAAAMLAELEHPLHRDASSAPRPDN